jgi:hypothetical protein
MDTDRGIICLEDQTIALSRFINGSSEFHIMALPNFRNGGSEFRLIMLLPDFIDGSPEFQNLSGLISTPAVCKPQMGS